MIGFIIISLTVGFVVLLFSKWVTRNYDVFEKQGIKYEKPLPLIGNSQWIFTGDLFGRLKRIYSRFPNEKVVGVFEFSKPTFFLRSPELIKQLTIKDFSYFQDHVSFTTAKNEELFGNILFSLKGKQWRDMRSTLSPLFTESKMRLMLGLIKTCADQTCEFLQEEHEKKGPTAYPVKKIFAKYANDVIATCAFGVAVNSFKYPNNDIYNICQTIMSGRSIIQITRFLIVRFFPRIAELFNITIVPNVVKIKFNELITHTINVRKTQNIHRPDMLQLLMRLKEGQKPKEKEMDEIDPENKMINGEFKQSWTDIELISQCFIFYLAGFDTTSTALSFCSYELAVNPSLQEKLILEIDETQESLGGNPLTYEDMQKMKYMDMFISEVLRLWPPVVSSDRECKKTYIYEDETGLKFTIHEGDALLVPIYALHMDPMYFSNPQKFDPERFSDENKSNINIHTYLPFGVGPRNCIGFRFALMAVKIIIFQLLLNFRITVCEDTQVPVKIKKSIFGLIPEKEIKLQFIPRKEKIA